MPPTPIHAAPLTLLAGADVFAPEPLGQVSVLIGGGTILWVGEGRPDIDPAYRAEVIDLTGLRLAPGLIDGHAHLTGGGGESGYASKVPAPMLTAYTLAGVTTVIGVLGTDDVTRTTAELVARARALEEEGLSAWCLTGGYHLPPVTLTGSVRGDIVHVDRIIGLGELAISDHRSSQPTLEELLRLAAEVHVAGMMSGKGGALHLHLGDGPRGLELVRQALEVGEVPKRVFHPTHVNRQEALLQEAMVLARRGMVIDLTAAPVMPGENGVSAAEAFLAYRGLGHKAERLTISSDCGGCLPRFDADGRIVHLEVGQSASLLACLREVVSAGVPLGEALAPMTANVARHWRLPGKGRLDEGMDADLVVLDDGLNVVDLWARGRHLVEGGRALARGRFEA
jgi:beta-aspartyl-dipeptidase (metallo-type)